MENQPPLDFLKHSGRIGKDINLTQLSGGNTSYKNEECLWVKASGRRLSDSLNSNIFCKIPFENLPKEGLDEIEDFEQYVVNGLKPSIETNFHLILNQPYVTHIHSLYSIAVGVGVSSSPSLLNLFLELGIVDIPYIKPGKELGMALKKFRSSSNPSFLLRNHGLIVGGNSLDFLDQQIEKIEKEFKQFITNLSTKENNLDWKNILIGGILTPDEAVFLGPDPFTLKANEKHKKIFLDSNNEIYFPLNFSEDKIIIAKFYISLARLLDKKLGAISYLSDSQVTELLIWEKEILRQGLIR